MALTRAKYRRVPDLYNQGTELVLKDGTVMWMQVINPFQRDEAQHDAQVARSRLVMALKSVHGSDERVKVQAAFFEGGRDRAIERLVMSKVTTKLVEILTDIRDDPEWTERLEITERQDELLARAPSDPERLLLEQINRDYLDEITGKQNAERDYQQQRLTAMSDEVLLEEYVDLYLDRRGNEIAAAEFALTEAWYAARVCDGKQLDDGQWDHSSCESHTLQVWETKQDLRSQPEELQDAVMLSLQDLSMSVRDARFSARQGSSSQSSPLPSEEGASTPSGPTATPAAAPGS